MSARFLFSVDLELSGLAAPAGERAEGLTEAYLAFLDRHGAKGTFFVVGDAARACPGLVRRLAAAGHEIACHSDRHVPLDRQGPARFRDDVLRNLDALAAAGAADVRGYRAPCFSLTGRTAWAHEVLASLGFAYSSSVLPARSPLYGWRSFGAAPRLVAGVLELPVTLLPWRLLPLPMAGGVYFRILPAALLRAAFARRRRAGEAVLGYLHPYDIDEAGRRGGFEGVGRGSPAGWLLRARRASVLPRLECLLRSGFAIGRYRDHAEALLSSGRAQ
jgi:polysaccharide deacetylase family protein (PEP-CTERM system associated)